MGTNPTYRQVVAIGFFALEFRTLKCHAVLSRNFEHALGAIFGPFDLQTCRPREANMGGLVLTKGTRHLINHFCKEFSGGRLKNLREDNILASGTNIRVAFADPGNDLSVLTNNIKHSHSPRGDNKCLLPDDNSGGQPHLEVRWILFLNSILSPDNHKKIKDGILKVLFDNSY